MSARPISGIIAFVAAILVQADVARAGRLLDEPLGFRIGLALDRGSAFTDVVALSAAAAYPYGSSPNPAADDFLRIPPNQFTAVFTGTGNYIAFSEGLAISAGAGSASYRFPRAGTLSLSYSRVDSHDGKTHDGTGLGLRSDELTLGYSHLVRPELAMGVDVRLTASTLNASGTDSDLSLRANNGSEGIDVRAGMMAGLGSGLILGVHAGVGVSRARLNGVVVTPDPPFGFGPQHFETRDEIVTTNIRAGLGWRPGAGFGAYGDAQYIKVEGHANGAEVGRFFAGIEYLPITAIALRLGGSIDTDEQLTVSAGIGVYPWKHVQLELAYVHNAFPEVRREFGRAHFVSASLAFPF